MEHILPPKVAAQVVNTTVTLTWGAVEFGRAFSESIIKYPVAMRLSCSTTATQAVYIGVRYSTATKDYRVAERKTIAQIPANGSVEITPSGVAALGLLHEYITSITVELTAASTGSTTVTLIIDDEPPPLSNDAGEFRGLDAVSANDYISIYGSDILTLVGGGVASTTLYTVPAQKRFMLDFVYLSVQITPSYPELYICNLAIINLALNDVFSFYARSDIENGVTVKESAFPMVFPAGYAVVSRQTNFDTTMHTGTVLFCGREIF